MDDFTVRIIVRRMFFFKMALIMSLSPFLIVCYIQTDAVRTHVRKSKRKSKRTIHQFDEFKHVRPPLVISIHDKLHPLTSLTPPNPATF